MPQIQASSQNQLVLSPTASGTVTPDPSLASFYQITMPAGNITIANPATSAVGQMLTFEFTQDGTGGRTITWGSKLLTAQQPTPAASAVSLMQFWFDGTNWMPLISLSAQTLVLSAALTTTAGSTTLAIVDGAYQVVNVSTIFTTASSSGTLTVTVDTGTNAPGAGTAQLTGTIALTGTTNTVSNGTVISTPTTTAAGNRIAFTTGGTLTGLVGGVVTVVLKRA